MTRVVPPTRSGDVYGYLAERVKAGEQGFVVVPAIEESDRGFVTFPGGLFVQVQTPLERNSPWRKKVRSR